MKSLSTLLTSFRHLSETRITPNGYGKILLEALEPNPTNGLVLYDSRLALYVMRWVVANRANFDRYAYDVKLLNAAVRELVDLLGSVNMPQHTHIPSREAFNKMYKRAILNRYVSTYGADAPVTARNIKTVYPLVPVTGIAKYGTDLRLSTTLLPTTESDLVGDYHSHELHEELYKGTRDFEYVCQLFR